MKIIFLPDSRACIKYATTTATTTTKITQCLGA